MDGLRDRLRRLDGGALTNTYFLFDPPKPLIGLVLPPDAAQLPPPAAHDPSS